MTDKEIIEGNKLIAEFMGGHKYGTTNMWTIKGYASIHVKDFRYHTLWDWLMPVVSKIWELQSANDMFNDELNARTPINRLTIFATLKDVYPAVLQFIQWYNSQNIQP